MYLCCMYVLHACMCLYQRCRSAPAGRRQLDTLQTIHTPTTTATTATTIPTPGHPYEMKTMSSSTTTSVDIDLAQRRLIENTPKEGRTSLRHNLLLREHGIVAKDGKT